MKNINKIYRTPLSSILFEQEEAEEEAAEEEVAEEEPASEEGGEAEDDFTDSGEEPTEDAEPGSEVENIESIDSDIEAVLIDFETSARKVAVSEASVRALYEAEDSEAIDVDTFTADVARLVKNYDNLLDIEGMLVNKSKEFLNDRYGEEIASNFIEKLEIQHDIEEPTSGDPIPDGDLTPLAVGAGSSGE